MIAEYRARLPVSDDTPVVTLGEGGTPLLRSSRLSEEVGADVYLKFEGANPTGSFKDRGMTVAVSRALEGGARAVACASTGNTSASAAAYAARAGLRCAVVVPRGGVAVGKMAQTLVAGATAFEVDGGFDEALRVTRALAEAYPVTLVNSVNPDRLQGQKTCAFEICDQLGRPPDLHLVPVGNAGNITSHWIGYREYLRDGVIDAAPALIGFQAAGAAPIVGGHPVAEPRTVASAIRIGNPASWRGAEEAARDSGGQVLAVPDEDILRAYEELAGEGLFAEPASAISVAGLRLLREGGQVPTGATAVCVLTGHGLKDPDVALGRATRPRPIAPDPDAVAAALGLR
ncbi:MAG TPA: threonine synthase [Actinomycetota bacterium]|nr:threonine synthase [Actinomycetota bacterium]